MKKIRCYLTCFVCFQDMFRDFAENGGQVVDAALHLKNYGNTMRADGMIENYITTSKQGGGDNVRRDEVLSLKGKSVSQMDTPDILADLVAALSRSFSCLKMPNANEQDPTGAYNTSTDEYESVLSYNPYMIPAEDRVAMLGKTSKSSLVNKDVSSKDARVTDRTALERKLKIITEGIELLKERLQVAQTRDKMETDRTALERKFQIISESVESLKERLRIAKTGDEMETVTALEEQMTLHNNALFLMEKTGQVVGEVLPSKKKPEKTVRTDDMVNNISSSKGGDDNMRENGLSHKGNSDSALDVTYILDEVVAALARTFVSLKITSVNGAEPRGGYTTSTDESEYESISNPHMISKERVAMMDRRRRGKSPIKSRVKGKGISSKAVMGESSRECEDDLKTVAQGVMFLKEHLLIVKARDSEENGEGEEQGLYQNQGPQMDVIFMEGAGGGSSSSLMKAGGGQARD